MSGSVSFTIRNLEALPVTGSQYYVKDTKTPNLVLLVSQHGTKTFYLRRKIGGKDERIRIGRFPEWTIEQAQKKVAALNVTINSGANPNQVKRSLRDEPSFGELFNRYLVEKRNRQGLPLSFRTKDEYEKAARMYLGPLMNKKMSEIRPDTLKKIHSGITSPAQANKVKAIVRAVFRWAGAEDITEVAAPTGKLKERAIQSRARFLQPDEVGRFLLAIEQSPHGDFFMLALLTGARRENVLAMAWRDINLSRAVWRIPKTKNGEAQDIPLLPDAVEILTRRKEQKVVNAIWVFPGTGEAGHMHMPRKAWTDLLSQADLDEHLRFHDLRRSMGSWQAMTGASLAVIGKSLGHRSSKATEVYARMNLDPVRDAMQTAVDAMRDQAKKK
jgi:integrase